MPTCTPLFFPFRARARARRSIPTRACAAAHLLLLRHRRTYARPFELKNMTAVGGSKPNTQQRPYARLEILLGSKRSRTIPIGHTNNLPTLAPKPAQQPNVEAAAAAASLGEQSPRSRRLDEQKQQFGGCKAKGHSFTPSACGIRSRVAAELLYIRFQAF